MAFSDRTGMIEPPEVLVVDDDQDIRDLVCFNLEKAGYRCLSAATGEEAMALLVQRHPDLAVLDIMLPDVSGLDILKSIRFNKISRQIPVVLLSARGEESDRLLGFELGADDYVVKPFSVRELLLRVRSILSRTVTSSEEELVSWNGIEVFPSRRTAKVEGNPIELTNTEFNLLLHFLRHPGRVLSREHLLGSVWNYRFAGTSRTVDTYVQRLRRKLDSKGDCIRTVRGVGYKLVARARGS